jgi:hypothetical protein
MLSTAVLDCSAVKRTLRQVGPCLLRVVPRLQNNRTDVTISETFPQQTKQTEQTRGCRQGEQEVRLPVWDGAPTGMTVAALCEFRLNR